jgi:hypothetical protein
MSDAWPETVKEAIEWHQEAARAALPLRREHEARQSPETKTALDLAELEVEKRHEWMCYIVGKENRRGR